MSASAIYRARWAAAGLCTNCGSRPHAFLSMRCDVCMANQRERGKRRNAIKRIAHIKATHALLTFNKRSKASP